MKASCDNVPISSPNNRDLDQISHWFLQQTARTAEHSSVSPPGLAAAQRNHYSD